MSGDSVERLNTVVAWEMFRKPLAEALNCSDRRRAGAQAEFQVMDRRIFGRFLGLLETAQDRRGLLATTNTGSEVWADTAYRANRPGFISRVHRKKPRGRPMRKNIEHGNRTRSRTRARVEHAFVWWQERSVPA